MSRNANLNLANLKPQLKRVYKRFSRHLAFAVILLVLLTYVFMVWRISGLTAAEPSPEAESAAIAQTAIPKVDKKAVERILSLEESSAEIHSLFEEARNNPFQE